MRIASEHGPDRREPHSRRNLPEQEDQTALVEASM